MSRPPKKRSSPTPKLPSEALTRRDFVKRTLETTALAASAAGVLSVPGALGDIVSGSDDEFEYIVIGSGAGGGPVAARLAQAGRKVLLLEAGGSDANNNTDIPAFHLLSTEDPAISWHFYVNHYSGEARSRRDSKWVPGKGVLYPRAATLGGCTVHNAMVTMYPDNSDWNRIAADTGDSTWRAERMRDYFQRMEKCGYVDPIWGNPGRNGFDGWLSTEQAPVEWALKDKKINTILVSAAWEMGLEGLADVLALGGNNLRLDPNDWNYVKDKTEGYFNVPKATERGRRSGPRQLLQQTAARYPKNLKIRTHALVTRLIFDENDPTKVVGVEYLEGAHLYKADPNPSSANAMLAKKKRVMARKEVIVSGGAFNSPQLLMLSGIGDREQLDRHKIDCRVHLPGVGKNLQDRYEVSVVSRLRGPFDLVKNCGFGAAGDQCLKDYRVDPSKSVYSTNGVLLGLIKKSHPWKNDPDLFLFVSPGIFRGYYPGYSKHSYKLDHFTWTILKGHTTNTAGEVSLRSKDPKDTPQINFRYFDEGNGVDEDLEAVVGAIKTVRRVNHNPFMRLMTEGEIVPGPGYGSDEQLRKFVMNEAWGHHASCSNKMGNAGDSSAVVGSDFKVHGVKGLRIVDASVFPRIPGLFIVVPVYMIAEKASESILRDAN